MPLSKILGAVAVIALTATATFAFTGPTNNPGSADSSAGSLLDQMAGSSFNSSTDSLEAIRDKIDSMPFTFSSNNVGIGKTPSQKLDVNGNISASRVYGVQWADISGRPSGLDDGDQVGITSESDPQVSAVTNGKWCRGNGSAVTCDQSTPLMSSPTTRPSATISAQNSAGEGGELHFAGSGGYGGVSLDNYMGDMRFHTFASGHGLQVLNGYVAAQSFCINGDCKSSWVPAPPTCTGSNRALQWNGSSWICATISTSSTCSNKYYAYVASDYGNGRDNNFYGPLQGGTQSLGYYLCGD